MMTCIFFTRFTFPTRLIERTQHNPNQSDNIIYFCALMHHPMTIGTYAVARMRTLLLSREGERERECIYFGKCNRNCFILNTLCTIQPSPFLSFQVKFVFKKMSYLTFCAFSVVPFQLQITIASYMECVATFSLTIGNSFLNYFCLFSFFNIFKYLSMFTCQHISHIYMKPYIVLDEQEVMK